MKVAILESIVTPAGHEVEFDRILVDELNRQGHEPVMFVPEKFPFKVEYKASVNYLDGGEAISYAGVGRLKRLWLSLQRERRRISWFNSSFVLGENNAIDLLIVPTTTWRGMRSLRHSHLINAKFPVVVIIHGVNPGEYPKFEREMLKLKKYKHIHICIVGLQERFPALDSLENFHTIYPPVFKPVYNCNNQTHVTEHKRLKFGFFGQFRKEKNIERFLDTVLNIEFSRPVEFIIQGSTIKPEDSELFDSIIAKYKQYSRFTFIHRALIGKEWEEAILDIDVLLMPYGAERYRYHWSAMLFTAMGFYKPVLQSSEINPEVISNYQIGEIISTDNLETDLKCFVENYDTSKKGYQLGLEKANNIFSHEEFVLKLFKVAGIL